MRLLVVSHPAVLAVNQFPYAELRRHGWDPFVVTPRVWRNQYAPVTFEREVLAELSGRVAGRRVLLPGRQQRHLYLSRIAGLIDRVRPHAAFVEEEPTSVAGFQWASALTSADVPFGLAADENLDRTWPVPARVFRRWNLSHAAFIAVRTPSSAAVLQRLGSRVPAHLIPHHVPPWQAPEPLAHDEFVIGYAGRLVPEKGLDVLLEAAAGLDGVVVRIVGNGPLRRDLELRASDHRVTLEIDSTVRHEQMAGAYAGFDVLVLPSRTTPTWAEQFGRVLVEGLACGVPFVASASGEIPWVLEETGGGIVVPEGDAAALRAAVIRIRDSPGLRGELAGRGRQRVRERFSVAAVARELDRALRTAIAQHDSARPLSSA